MTRTQVAIALWAVLAVVVWNVVFDQVLVFAGRRYIVTASGALRSGGDFVLLGPWMRDAARDAFWAATASAAVVLALAWAGLRAARRSSRVKP
jgi:hypothetical protein